MVSSNKIIEGNGGPRTICIMNMGPHGGKNVFHLMHFSKKIMKLLQYIKIIMKI
jgi:hypothetical protein